MQLKLLLLMAGAILAMIGLSPAAEAMVTPVGVSLLPPIAFPLRNSSIVGARFNFFIGIHQSVYGLDLGIVGNMTDKDFGGLQLAGIFNRNKGHASIVGAQLSGLGNWNLGGSDIYGIQATLGLNTNYGKAMLIGLGVGVLGNRSQGTVAGAQVGIYNQAKNVYGLQLGICNVAQSLHGIQIGLVNINRSGPLVFFPIVNIGF